jgi:hypothetical protein
VGQTMAFIGSTDPRLDHRQGNVDIRLSNQLGHFSKVDLPSARVQPVPTLVLRHNIQLVWSDPNASEGLRAATNLMIIAYYFPMRPGEYSTSTSAESSHPFHKNELELWIGQLKLNLSTCSHHELLMTTFCILMFSDQNNACRGKKVGHAPSGDNLFCPCRALAHRLIHQRKNGAPAHTPIHAYYKQHHGCQLRCTAQAITTLLRHSMLPC